MQRGYGFVTFINEEESVAALAAMANITIDEVSINCAAPMIRPWPIPGHHIE